MKSFDSLIPYILASMHPLMHMTLLLSSVILIMYDTEKFYAVTGTCPVKTQAYNFMTEGKYWLMMYIMSAHLAAIILHYSAQVLSHYGYKTLANTFVVLKVTGFLYVIMEVQNRIIYDECNDVTDNMVVMAWLTYELIAFYFNIIGLMVFLFVASCRKFETLREREGFAGKMRKTRDFLQYCKDDVHWFQIWFTQVGLFFVGILFREDKIGRNTIGLSASEAGVTLLLGLALVSSLYFGKGQFEFTKVTWVLLAATFVICGIMAPRFVITYDQGRIWWSPIVLEIIVAHVIIYI